MKSGFRTGLVYKDSNEDILYNVLSVFSNGLAILKIEYIINDVEVSRLSEKRLFAEYDHVLFPLCCNDGNFDDFGCFKSEAERNEADVGQRLINAICHIANDKADNTPYLIDYHILFLSEYTSKTESPNSSQQYSKDILYLTAAPMFEYNEPSPNKIKEMLDDAHYELNRYAHVYVSTVGRTIAVSVNDNAPLPKYSFTSSKSIP